MNLYCDDNISQVMCKNRRRGTTVYLEQIVNLVDSYILCLKLPYA